MPLDSQMTPLQVALWHLLRERYYGVARAAPRAAVLAWFNMSHNPPIDDRDFRELKSVLVSVFKKPICSSPGKGYYVARNRGEKQEAINYLESVLREVGELRAGLVESKTEEEDPGRPLL